MSYHELPCPVTPRPMLRIGDSVASEETYDLDNYGQDDGTDPRSDATFRVLFQLGFGYEIYLYVVGLRCASDPRGFHSFWLRDCAVYEVEPAEYGAQKRVTCAKATLPPVYGRVNLGSATSYVVLRMTFESRPTGAVEPDFELCWHVRDQEMAVVSLTYSSHHGWRFADAGGERALTADERVTFAEPIAPVRDWPTKPPPGITWQAETYPGDTHGGPLVSTVVALLDHATALAWIRGHFIFMPGGESVGFSSDARHVMTIRSETHEAYGSSANDSYSRQVTVWDVTKRTCVFSQQLDSGYQDGVMLGLTSATFSPDGGAVHVLAGDRVVRVVPLP